LKTDYNILIYRINSYNLVIILLQQRKKGMSTVHPSAIAAGKISFHC